MTADLAMMPAHELVKLFKARKASPVEATKAAFARIDAFNGQLNAFQHLDPDTAMRQARAARGVCFRCACSALALAPASLSPSLIASGSNTTLCTVCFCPPFLCVELRMPQR